MLAFGLPASSLLTETNAFGRFINYVLMDLFFAATDYSVRSEIILTIFCEKMLAGNLPDR